MGMTYERRDNDIVSTSGNKHFIYLFRNFSRHICINSKHLHNNMEGYTSLRDSD